MICGMHGATRGRHFAMASQEFAGVSASTDRGVRSDRTLDEFGDPLRTGPDASNQNRSPPSFLRCRGRGKLREGCRELIEFPGQSA